MCWKKQSCIFFLLGQCLYYVDAAFNTVGPLFLFFALGKTMSFAHQKSSSKSMRGGRLIAKNIGNCLVHALCSSLVTERNRTSTRCQCCGRMARRPQENDTQWMIRIERGMLTWPVKDILLLSFVSMNCGEGCASCKRGIVALRVIRRFQRATPIADAIAIVTGGHITSLPLGAWLPTCIKGR